YVSGAGAGWGFAPAGQNLTASYVGALAAGDSSTFTVTVAVGAAAVPSVTNTATVGTGGDLSASNDTDSDVTGVTGTPDMTIDKRHIDDFEVNATETYHFVVTNLGTA